MRRGKRPGPLPVDGSIHPRRVTLRSFCAGMPALATSCVRVLLGEGAHGPGIARRVPQEPAAVGPGGDVRDARDSPSPPAPWAFSAFPHRLRDARRAGGRRVRRRSLLRCAPLASLRRSAAPERGAWVHVAYAAVWLFSLCAAVRALLGVGGLRVAVLAIVPIVLLAPPASSEPGCSLVAARSLPRPRHVRGRPADQAGRWRSPTRRDRLAGRFTRAG